VSHPDPEEVPVSRFPLFPLVTAALATGLLTACSAGAPAAPAEPTPAPRAAPAAAALDPCTLLHDDEATAILHGAPTRSGPVDRNRGTTCTWTTASGNLLAVHVYRGHEFYAPEIQAPDARKLPGVGDDAFVDKGVAAAITGENVVFVDAVGPGTQAGVEAALRAAMSRAPA
jgi:hypothetical protein